MKRLRLLAGIATLAALVGCSPVNIKCKVLEGQLSTIAVVAGNDVRFEEDGIEGVEITVRQSGRAGDTVIRTTDDDGRASIPLAGTGALSRPMEVEVRAPGYVPAVTTMPTPTPGQRLLILLEPIRSRAP